MLSLSEKPNNQKSFATGVSNCINKTKRLTKSLKTNVSIKILFYYDFPLKDSISCRTCSLTSGSLIRTVFPESVEPNRPFLFFSDTVI